MIYIDKTKFTVDGVDVYPDHELADQFWYVPGAIRLAERDNRKALSYLWYTDSEADSDGTGFLNFEVNTAVSAATLDKIRNELVKRTGLERRKINLAPVTFHSGRVNFSVLGPMAAQAPADLSKDASVLYQSKEQLVWSAGSSSLVGDNSAVCSVRFTKEGKLAAAMKHAILNGANSIAALYKLKFLAMRPAITFKVHGTLEKTVKDFQIGIGAQIPLEAFILDVGIQAQWQRVMANTDLKIEVVNFTGEEEEGLKWAQKVLLDYVLDHFFEVQIGPGNSDWKPLSEEPEVKEVVDEAKDIEEAAEEAVEEEDEVETKGKTEEDTKEETKEGEPEKEEAKEDGKEETKEEEKKESKEEGKKESKEETKGGGAKAAVKELVKAATSALPKVNIRAAYYDGKQVNTIDFVYSEMKAKSFSILPQSLVLEGLKDPPSYITQVNRAQDPFGLPYNVTVSTPDDDDRTKVGLKAVNVEARYPAGAPKDRQSTQRLTIVADKVTGPNPFPFQYDARGAAEVEYSVDYVFKPSDDWQAEAYEYSLKGKTEKGLISAMAESVVEFLVLDIRLDTDFVWDDVDQAVVTLTSKKWKGEKRVVFQRNRETEQTLSIRSDAKFQSAPIQYKIDLRKGNKTLYSHGLETVTDKQVIVRDRFAGHIPVYFTASFDEESVDVNVLYEDGDFVWEDQFTLEKGKKRVQRIVPTMKEFRRPSELKLEYEVTPESGEPFRKKAQGGQNVTVKLAAS
jgi:hypothetical protein